MAASQEQKVDFLLKKIGYTASKTGIAEDETGISGTKKAPFGEAIPSPLTLPGANVWAQSNQIPTTPPVATTPIVRVYKTGSAQQLTFDSTVADNRSFVARETVGEVTSTVVGDWVDTQFGADYIVKVYKGDPNSGGVQLSAAGSGSNDTWFFDYSAGVLNFNGTNVPSGITTTNIFIEGYRYTGIKGVTGVAQTFTNLEISGITTFNGAVDMNSTLDVDGDTQLDDLNVAGVATFSNTVDVNADLNVSGLSTFIQVSVNAGVVTFTNVSSTPSDSLPVGTGGHIYSFDDGLRIVGDNGGIRFHSAGFARWKIDTAGTFAPLSTDGLDIGSSIYPVSNLIVSGNAGIGSLNITGVSTFANDINANGNIIGDNATNISGINSVTATNVFSNLTGNVVGNLTGNADTAGKADGLTTARTIGGVSFDGSANINLPGVNTSGNQDTSGNAATATALETARNIGGVSFDGTASINLPGVNQAGNQNTSGTAAGLSGSPTITITDVSGVGGNFTGVVTASSGFSGNLTGTLQTAAQPNITSLGTLTGLTVSGAIDANGTLDVDGDTQLDDLNVAGVATFSSLVDVNNRLDVVGGANIDELNVAGISTFAGITTVTGNTLFTKQLSVSGLSTFAQSVRITGSIQDFTVDSGIFRYDNGKLFLHRSGQDAKYYSGVPGGVKGPHIFYTHEGGSTVEMFRLNGDTGATLVGVMTATKFVGNLTGNADTAGKADGLTTARTIGGVSFDGSSNINLPGVNQAGNQNTSGTAAGLSGSPNITITDVSGVGGNFTGVVTASSGFSGNLTGTLQTAAQPNITSLGTLSAVTVSGNINANGNIVGDSATNITGIAGVTASTLTGTLQTAAQPNVTSLGTLSSLNVTGDVSIGGTLTYEDVTNIDSVGLLTARSGIVVVGNGVSVGSGIVTSNDGFSGNLTGNVIGNLTGNADTSGKADGLTTARTIGGVSFDGSANINLPGVNISGNQNTSGTAAGLSGSPNITITDISGVGGNFTGVVTASSFSGNLATTDLTGTITNAQLAGSIANDKLSNSTVSYGGVSLALGSSDATPAFDLSDATNYPTSSLSGTITNAQLAGSIANDKLANSTVSYGGISLALGGTDATPAFNLSDATNYPFTSLTGITTSILGDATPTLGGDLNGNSKNIFGVGIVTASKAVFTEGSVTDYHILIDPTNPTRNGTIKYSGTKTFFIEGGTHADNRIEIHGHQNSLNILCEGQGETELYYNNRLALQTQSGGVGIVGILTAKGVNAIGVVTATDFSGNISGVGATFTNITGTLQTAAQPNITSLGTLSSATVSGDINANGNIVGDNSTNISGISSVTATSYFGNGENLTGIGTQGSRIDAESLIVSGISTFNDDVRITAGGLNVTGVVTATSFSGNLATTDLTGTITNAQLAGSIANDKLVNDSVSFGGVSVDLGSSDATPAFDLSDATNYPTSSLSGTITNAQLAGSIANDKLANSSVNFGGVSLSLGGSDATPAFDLSDATNYPFTSLTGITTSIVGDTTPKLGGDLNGNSKNIFGVGISSASAFADFDYLQAPFGSTVNFTVVVGSKDSTHRYNGSGSGNAYIINGVQAPILNLTPGRTYRFVHDNTGIHPLKFYYDANRSTLYTTGVNFQNTYTEITISDTTPNVLHYQCTNHPLMGNAIITNSNVVDSPYAATLRDTLTVTNNITANGNIAGDGSTNITGIDGVTASTLSGTVQTAAQPNITSLGTLSSATVSGDINANGNIVGDNSTNISGISSVTATSFFGNGSGLTGIGTQTNLGSFDNLVVAGISTFNDEVRITAGGINAVGIVTGTAFAGYDYLQAPYSSTVSLTVTVDSKSNHRYQGQGSGNAFYINGVESPVLTLTPGRTYRFVHDNTGSHPLKFYYDAARTTLYTAGVDFQNSYTEITITDTTPNVLHYQCVNHALMGNSIITNSNVVDSRYGLNIVGVSTFANNVQLKDNVSLKFGDNKQIIATPGDLEVEASGSEDITLTVNASGGTASDIRLKTGSTESVKVNGDGGVIVTGILTATDFSGNISGVGATFTNITGTLQTAAQPNITSVGTLSSLNVSGDVSIGGTLTYEDVTNIDSVGLITARNGVRITAGGLNLTGVSTFNGDINGTGDFTLTDTDTGSSAGPEFKLYRNSASPADADYLGQIKFAGESDTGVERNYAKITGKILDASNGTEDGIIEFAHIKAGSQTITGRFRSDSLQLLNGTALSVAGDITANGNIAGDGSTNITGINEITAAGNITANGNVIGDDSTNISGINSVTATSFFGNGSGLTGIGTQTNLGSFDNLVVSGIATFHNNVFVGSAITMISSSGIVSATKFLGDGSELSGIAGFSPDDQKNLYAGTCAGASSDADTCFNIAVGECAGRNLNEGDQNIFLGTNSGNDATTASCNVALGLDASRCMETGTNNVAIGRKAGGATGSGTSGNSNVSIGYQAAVQLTSGNYNVVMGTNAGGGGAPGSRNVAIGLAAGFCGVKSSDTIAIGHKAGCRAADPVNGCGIFIGKNAGELATEGKAIMIGFEAGKCAVDADNSIFIGSAAGKCACNASDGNLFIGINAGRGSSTLGDNTGDYNIAFGKNALINYTSASDNVVIGCNAGCTITSGSCNVLIGYGATVSSATGNNQLAIGAGNTNWIAGDSSYNVCVAGAGVTMTSGTTSCVIAHKFCGDGSCLTGLAGFSADSQENLYAGSSSGSASDADTCFNVGIGFSAGAALNEGDDNVLIGTRAGNKLTSGNCNVLIGKCAGCNMTGTVASINIGAYAGACLDPFGGGNILLGSCAGKGCSGGGANSNVMIGNVAGCKIGSGDVNIFLGSAAGKCYTTGGCNIFLGQAAGFAANTTGTGSNNIGLGQEAGYCLSSGGCNIFLGRYSGCFVTTGSHNVIIGCRVHPPSPTDNCQLAIGNGSNLWIGGTSDFMVGIGTTNPSSRLSVAGDACVSGVITATNFAKADGSSLGGFEQDSQGNLIAGTGAGAAADSDTCFNIMLGCNSGRSNCAGDHNLFLGCNAGCLLTSGSNNLMIGKCAGRCITTGTCNIAFGIGAMSGGTTTGVNNIAIGQKAGQSNTSGSRNIFLGQCAGNTNTSGGKNIAIGCNVELPSATDNCQFAIGNGTDRWIVGDSSYNVTLAGIATVYSATGIVSATKFCGDGSCLTNISAGFSPDADENLFAGTDAGGNLDGSSGCFNVLLGKDVGKALSSGANNTVMGCGAGEAMTSGSCNVIIGKDTMGNATVTGSNNVAIGCMAGRNITGGNNNTIMGQYAGGNLTTGCSNFIVGLSAAGSGTLTGTFNILLGDCSGKQSSSATGNVFLGRNAGRDLTTGSCNIGIGYHAMMDGTVTGGNNIAIGKLPLQNVTSGTNNIAMGQCALGTGVVTGEHNIAIGFKASKGITSAENNIFIGRGAGINETITGSKNVVIGNYAATNITSGGCNLILGQNAGRNITSGGFNVAIGAYTPSATDSCQLVIGVPTNKYWITGNSDFNVGIGTTTVTSRLTVAGDVNISGVATATDFDSTSDIRLKTNIKPIDDPVSKVIQIEGVSFNWKKDDRPALGVIADQVEKILPQLVHGDDPKTVNYNGLVGLLIEVVKDQQKQIDTLSERISKLE